MLPESLKAVSWRRRLAGGFRRRMEQVKTRRQDAGATKPGRRRRKSRAAFNREIGAAAGC
jgi:hypothetical protein